MKNFRLMIIVIVILCVNKFQASIPDHLLECYRSEAFQKTKLPMNLPVLLDIIRKAEKYSNVVMDMRTMSSSILHRFKFDGIDYDPTIKLNYDVLAVGGTGTQHPRNQLVEELVPGDAKAFPTNALTLIERCTLHRALSNAIWEHEDPSEEKMCDAKPTEKVLETSMVNEQMTCPLEQGVILTPYGTTALGTLIAAVAAALQPQNVTVKLLVNSTNKFDFNEDEVELIMSKDEIDNHRSMWYNSLQSSAAEVDNVWLTTVSGELAELSVYQGPVLDTPMSMGVAGSWNSTVRPTRYYLQKDTAYDMTRAEIVGAVDGFIIAKNLQSWNSKFSNLRLSQVLDMFYSEKGPSFDSRIRACERGKSFWYVASKTILEEQTFLASQLLAYRRSIVYMSDAVLRTITNQAVEGFTNYVNKNLFPEIRCSTKAKEHRPHVEIIVTFDGGWSVDATADFLTILANDIDVSMYGSRIGLIHGNTGKWILNVTDSLSSVHESILNFTSLSWPTGLNFTNYYSSVEKYLNQSWSKAQAKKKFGDLAQVLLLLIPSSKLNSSDQSRVISIVDSLKFNYPDVHFMYYVSQSVLPTIQPLLRQQKNYFFISTGAESIKNQLLKISRTLRFPKCQNKFPDGFYQVEEYIEPQEIITYELHPQWRANYTFIEVKIVSVDYGTLKVCWWIQSDFLSAKKQYTCKELSGHNELILSDLSKCAKNEKCPYVFYEIHGISSTKKCAEIDCKTPDHIRYIIRVGKVQCSGGEKSTLSLFYIFITIELFIVFNSIFI